LSAVLAATDISRLLGYTALDSDLVSQDILAFVIRQDPLAGTDERQGTHAECLSCLVYESEMWYRKK
jgi:hypothetical protein